MFVEQLEVPMHAHAQARTPDCPLTHMPGERDFHQLLKTQKVTAKYPEYNL